MGQSYIKNYYRNCIFYVQVFTFWHFPWICLVESLWIKLDLFIFVCNLIVAFEGPFNNCMFAIWHGIIRSGLKIASPSLLRSYMSNIIQLYNSFVTFSKLGKIKICYCETGLCLHFSWPFRWHLSSLVTRLFSLLFCQRLRFSNILCSCEKQHMIK